MKLLRLSVLAAIVLTALPQLSAAAGEWDAETDRYVAELQALGVEGGMFDIQSQAFARALPDMRAKMWNDLKIVRRELDKEGLLDLRQAQIKARTTPDHDTETISYKAALESAGKSAEEVNGLVTLFSISNEAVRKVLWDDLGGRP